VLKGEMRLRPKLAAVPVAAAAALAAGGAAVPADAGNRPACSSPGSATVLASRSARVFTKRGTVRPNYRVRRYYACSYRRDRRIRIGIVGEPGVFATSLTPIRLAGRFVAYATFLEGAADGSQAYVDVRDLRTGARTKSVTAGEPDEGQFSHDFQGPIQDLELRSNGSVAWIEKTFTTGDPLFRVVKHDAGGRAVLDAGTDVDPRSLALSGSRLYWTRGGTPFAATLD
jgi:hypothetical protein